MAASLILAESKPCSSSSAIFEVDEGCTSYSNADREDLRLNILEGFDHIFGNASMLERDAKSQPEFLSLLSVSILARSSVSNITIS